uniref:Uncharacterized protein n=1 Tax=Eutreptiella gymnastica TaxID=73025 RepID=A0A7S4GAZ8_9EUGL
MHWQAGGRAKFADLCMVRHKQCTKGFQSVSAVYHNLVAVHSRTWGFALQTCVLTGNRPHPMMVSVALWCNLGSFSSMCTTIKKTHSCLRLCTAVQPSYRQQPFLAESYDCVQRGCVGCSKSKCLMFM